MTPQTYRDPEARKRDGAEDISTACRLVGYTSETSGSLRAFQAETLRRRYALPPGLAGLVADLHFCGRGARW